MRFYFYTRE